jgi:hypothetical protein
MDLFFSTHSPGVALLAQLSGHAPEIGYPFLAITIRLSRIFSALIHFISIVGRYENFMPDQYEG